MEEGCELTGAPLVWFGQIEVLQVEDETFTVLGFVHTSRVGADGHASLTELLQDVRRGGLGRAVDGGHLG